MNTQRIEQLRHNWQQDYCLRPAELGELFAFLDAALADPKVERIVNLVPDQVVVIRFQVEPDKQMLQNITTLLAPAKVAVLCGSDLFALADLGDDDLALLGLKRIPVTA